MEWILIVLVLIVVGVLIFRAPYFQAMFEHRDREPFIDNKVVTPPRESLSLDEQIRRAEEAGTLDEHGMTRE